MVLENKRRISSHSFDILSDTDRKIDDVQAQLEPLQALLVSLQAERSELERRLHASASSSRSKAASSSSHSNTLNGSHHHGAHTSMINYHTDTFPWSQQLLPVAKRTFDISQFRLCQEGVINAAMDGRDIVCVMPTGGGKSLTYQLPAVMGKGVTVVISPLLALIWDQCRALTEAGVKSVVRHSRSGIGCSVVSLIKEHRDGGAHDGLADTTAGFEEHARTNMADAHG
jgi:ATP-dependent DNA helicase Q1